MKHYSNSESLRKVYVEQAIKADQQSDKPLWKSALFCSRVVGKYEKGATQGLADDMNRSVDTVEDRAHAYMMFEKLCKLDNGRHRLYIFHARRSPHIHLSHFRSLWDAQKDFELTDSQVMGLLVEIVQQEISSRGISDVIRKHFGKDRSWLYHAERISKEIYNLINHKDTPSGVRKTFRKVMKILPDPKSKKSN